jgi:hypothetical protein
MPETLESGLERMFTFSVSSSDGASVRCHGCGWTTKGASPKAVYPRADRHVCPASSTTQDQETRHGR